MGEGATAKILVDESLVKEGLVDEFSAPRRQTFNQRFLQSINHRR